MRPCRVSRSVRSDTWPSRNHLSRTAYLSGIATVMILQAVLSRHKLIRRIRTFFGKSLNVAHMRRVARVFLTVVAYGAMAISVVILFQWVFYAYGALTGSSQKIFSALALSQASGVTVLIGWAMFYFGVVGGVVGWVALFRLFQLSERNLSQLPKWVIYGCAIGIAAALVTNVRGPFAYFPIVAAIALLLRCYLAAPNPPRSPDAPASGAPVR